MVWITFSFFHNSCILVFAIIYRFPEVAKLCLVFSLEIRGIVNTFSLSENTRYAAYLVFKMLDDYGFENEPMDLSIDVEGGHSSTKSVCLDPNASHNKERTCSRNHSYKSRTVCKCPGPRWRPFPNVIGLQRPTMRSDGWLEIEMGRVLQFKTWRRRSPNECCREIGEWQ